jgi:cytochrome oxidase Cu insertion factor (SCO1/SenC/PrrC family)
MAVRFWVAVLVLGGCAYAWHLVRRNRSDDVPPPAPPVVVLPAGIQVGDFTLTERSGRTFQSKELAGKVWVASFFFTGCPGPCIKLNTQIAALARDLSDVDVTFVSITVDPEHDTPEALVRYADHYGADPAKWLFLTGDRAEIERVAVEQFRLPVEKASHSTRLVLVGPAGDGEWFDSEDPRELTVLKMKIFRYLEEQEPPASEGDSPAGQG